MAINVEEYYRTYGPMVMRRCLSLLRDEEAAADAMQDTFVKLLRHQDRLEHRGPSSLLYTIATNVCLNRIRSSSRDLSEPAGDSLEFLGRTEDESDRVDAAMVLERIMARQNAITRRMVEQHYVKGMTLKETADATGYSVSGVRKRLRQLKAEAKSVVAA